MVSKKRAASELKTVAEPPPSPPGQQLAASPRAPAEAAGEEGVEGGRDLFNKFLFVVMRQLLDHSVLPFLCVGTTGRSSVSLRDKLETR